MTIQVSALISKTCGRAARAHGKVPRSANAPGEPPCVDQSENICARMCALSRFPACNKCGSAKSNAPSTGIQKRVNERCTGEACAPHLCKVVPQRNGGGQDRQQDMIHV